MAGERTRDQAESQATEQPRESPGRTAGGDTFHAGPIPPVAEDDNVRELKTKVGALIQSKFGGDYKKAFTFYDADKDGGVNKDEIVSLLKDADVGNGLTRGAWANGILDKVDASHDKKIQWAEFETVFKA